MFKVNRHKQCDTILGQHGIFQLHQLQSLISLKSLRCERECLLTFAQISKMESRGEHGTGHREHPNSRALIIEPVGPSSEHPRGPGLTHASWYYCMATVTKSFGEFLLKTSLRPWHELLETTHPVNCHPRVWLQQNILVLCLSCQLTSGRLLCIPCLSFSVKNAHNNAI